VDLDADLDGADVQRREKDSRAPRRRTLSETDDSGRPVLFGKVAVVAVVGNEDGAHKIVADTFQALNDTGYSIPAQGCTYWNGEAMYIYHPLWRERRDREKYDRVLALPALPAFRREVIGRLDDRGAKRSRVVHAALLLLDLGVVDLIASADIREAS
jgi:hypothetical protein